MSENDRLDGVEAVPGGFDELDGHTLEELADYLESGREPRNPAIEASPACRLALDALAKLRGFTAEAMAAEVAAEPAPDEGWVQGILAGIAHDVRAGRKIPIAPTEPVPSEILWSESRQSGVAEIQNGAVESVPEVRLGMTEGAVRGVIRSAESAVSGVLIGRCHFDGEVTEWGAPTRILVDVSVQYGVPIHSRVARLRHEIAARLAHHTELNVSAVDIRVRDVQWWPARAKEEK